MTVELIALAVQAVVRFLRAGREIYREGTVSREIAIPLPAGFKSDVATARDHAVRVRDTDAARFEREFRRAYDESFNRPEAERELVGLYLVDLSCGRVGGITANVEELAGVAALRQFEPGASPFPHPLQRVAGALVETAVDYFVSVPGAIDGRSKYGRALRAFLEGLDDFDFQEARWDSIVLGLFTAALDSGADLSRSDELRVVMKGVAGDVQRHLKALPATGDLDAEARIAAAGQLVLRSMLRHAGDFTPVAEVGGALVDLVLGGKALRGPAIDRLVRAGFTLATEHPRLRDRFDRTLRALKIDDDLFADVAAIVIERGGAEALVDAAHGIWEVLRDGELSRSDTLRLFDIGLAAAAKVAPKEVSRVVDIAARSGIVDGPFLHALLASGAAASLLEHDVTLVVERADELRAAIEADGVAGLAEMVADGRALDVLRAVAGSGVLDRLMGAKPKAAVAKIVRLVSRVRGREVARIPQMIKELAA